MSVFEKVGDSCACSVHILSVVVDVIVEGNQLSVLPEGPLAEAIGMEVMLVGKHVEELFADEVQMSEPCFKVPTFKQRLASLDDIPLVLQLVEAAIFSCEETKYLLTDVGLLAFHYILYTDVVHVTVSKIHFACLVHCL